MCPTARVRFIERPRMGVMIDITPCHNVMITPIPCYLLPKTNFLRFNLPLKRHKGDKCDLGSDTRKPAPGFDPMIS